MKKIIRIPLLLAFLAVQPAEAEMLGIRGAVYPIAERPFLEEAKELAASIPVRPPSEEELKNELNSMAGGLMAPLPRAERNNYRLVDISWTAEMDWLPTPHGVVYPAGFKYNPAEYAHYPLTIVVFDASDETQREWFWRLYDKNPLVKAFISGGNWLETEFWLALKLKEKRLKAGETVEGTLTAPPLYPLPRLMLARFQLRAVPCTVMQEGTFLAVTEYADIEVKQ